MTLSTNDPRPPYQQVADIIRAEIRSGRIKPGERLPSYRELQDRFDIANMTARSALQVLRDEGLVQTVHGRGSFVTDYTAPAADEPPAEGEEWSATGRVEPDALDGALRAIRDQLRTMNAEMQDLRQEVADLKARLPQERR
ncbi:hypothetical protein T261_3965 [Streptomyces lydicus]|nr:hypothetical protein T261_3965 [Streptomyces lydicus]